MCVRACECIARGCDLQSSPTQPAVAVSRTYVTVRTERARQLQAVDAGLGIELRRGQIAAGLHKHINNVSKNNKVNKGQEMGDLKYSLLYWCW